TLKNNVNLNKVGTGKLKLSGISSHKGTITATAGTLELTGALNGTGVATVASGATLKGTGSIVGATTVNGILEGRLNFGSDLTLAGTTNLVVNGFDANQYDVVSVVGTVNNGGTLNITVNATAPAMDTTVKLINASAYVSSFTTINTPANYTFDSATGILTYTVGTKLSENNINNFKVYPTITRNSIQIDGENIASVQIMNLVGQTVKEINTSATKTTINLNELSEGSYLVKACFADNSVKVQRILLCK
ncbi:MAG: T9SS type A sorting domain-containing protein, partial [Paludibacter sp.]|nr:T9SS type A sorting domain-containing protein [Paludibacter sp.]